ncbi:MAG TPA: metalloregulator ArsR/SmtB family transcription factor [Casimicrobiaceae bacterium]|jgi:DNA-binding transcriptional ArsR family regulator|nr:metalloregulator ArsR/SmtB family transcription factor [Casimicrobiaceae bacterium]
MIHADHQLSALADPSRRAILEALARQPLAVGELAQRLPISRPAVSQHLRVLADANLVAHEPRGTRNVYRLDTEGLETLRQYLDALWGRALRDFKRVAESSYHAKRRRPR